MGILPAGISPIMAVLNPNSLRTPRSLGSVLIITNQNQNAAISFFNPFRYVIICQLFIIQQILNCFIFPSYIHSRYNHLHIVSSDYASIAFSSGDFHYHMEIEYARKLTKNIASGLVFKKQSLQGLITL